MNLETSLHSLLSFAWTLTRPTNNLRQNIVFSCSETTSFFFSISLFFVSFFVILRYYLFLQKLFYYYYIIITFFMKIIFIFSCSGMFRNVPCSWFYRRPSSGCSNALVPLPRKGVDKTRNMEHSGTCRNIPEHPGTWKKINIFLWKIN